MELWRQLRQAGLVPPGLGPPPRALRGPPPVRTAGQTLLSSGVEAAGTRESLLWIWEELVSEGLERQETGGGGQGGGGCGELTYEWKWMKLQRDQRLKDRN